MRRKISSLIAAVSIVLLTVTVTFSALQMFMISARALDLNHSLLVIPPGTPAVLTTLPQNVEYKLNVTSNGADFINATSVEVPTGWTYVSSIAPAGWSVAASSGQWVNFTTTLTTFSAGMTLSFNVTVGISMVPPTSGTWTVFCYEGTAASTSNPSVQTVTVSLKFDSTMTPSYVTNSSYIYTITTTNDYANVGIKQLNVSFPTDGGWIFNQLVDYTPRTWSVVYDSVLKVFQLTGPSILIGEVVTFKVNMTVAYPTGTTHDPDYWNVTAWDSSSANLGKFSISAVVDNYAPAVLIDSPQVLSVGYSVGSGNKIWVNASVTDFPSIDKYPITISINDSRFGTPSVMRMSETVYAYSFANTTYIPDGTLAFAVSAVDKAGNTGTTKRAVTVDNSPPLLKTMIVYDQSLEALYQDPSGIFWMKADTTTVYVNATFYNPSNFNGYIYFNLTGFVFANGTDTPSGGFSVVGSNLVNLNITLVDHAVPTANRYTNTWKIQRDTQPPPAPTYTKKQDIAGGLVLWRLNATDNVGIQYYDIWVNGTHEFLYPDDLDASTLGYYEPFASFAGIVAIDYSGFMSFSAGDVANVTIQAVDYGSNVGTRITLLETVQGGMWYPLELYPGWNLVSWPLIPSNTAPANIYSLILKQGATDVLVTYGYDQTADQWNVNPAQMPDGFGYWINVNSYDVLIVQGKTEPDPPAVPASYLWTKGWVIGGYKSIDTYNGTDYLSSLQAASYFKLIYTWDAADQKWNALDTTQSGTYLYPGNAFWIYMYNDQYLIPPST